MDKLNFSHFYKFIVSLGIALVLFSISIPYFFLKESYGLFITSKKMLCLSNESINILQQKQFIYSIVSTIIPFVVIALFIIGSGFFIWGLIGWYNKQKDFDRKISLENKKLEKEIENMSPEEIVEKAISETNYIEDDMNLLINNEDSPIFAYLKVEILVIKLLKMGFSKKYRVNPNQKILFNKGYYAFDVLLLSLNNSEPDVIIEIKLSRRGYSKHLFKETIEKLREPSKQYSKRTNKNIKIVCLFVYDNETISDKKLSKYEIDFLEIKDLNEDLQIDAAFISLDIIEKMEASKFNSHLLKYI